MNEWMNSLSVFAGLAFEIFFVGVNHLHVERLWCVNTNQNTLFKVCLCFMGTDHGSYCSPVSLGKVDKKQVIWYEWERRDGEDVPAEWAFDLNHLSHWCIYVCIYTTCRYTIYHACCVGQALILGTDLIFLCCNFSLDEDVLLHTSSLMSGHLLAAWSLQSLFSVTLTDSFCHSSRLRCRNWSCVFAG